MKKINTLRIFYYYKLEMTDKLLSKILKNDEIILIKKEELKNEKTLNGLRIANNII